jgi:hypothetical protein
MKKLLLIFALVLLGACAPKAKYPRLIETEAQMVQDCQYLNTVAYNADPGRLFPKIRNSDAEQAVLYNAAVIGATHVVWVYNNQLGSAAELYKCE